MAQGQTTPYLGSRISLISKSEIRYEGILYTVDTKESTIALAKVKSFGTEDRPTEHPVAPRDEVYEYIIFKASDIKDLMVRETPKPVPQLCPGLPYDPAIVSVSQQPGALGPSMAPGGPIYHGSKSTHNKSPSSRTSPTVNSSVQTAAPHGNRAPQRPRNVTQSRSNNNYHPGHRGGNQQHMGAPRGGQGMGRGFSRGGGAQGQGHMMRGGRGGGPVPNARTRSTSQPRLKFDEEYDFEKSQQQFNKILDSVTQELTTTNIGGEGDDHSLAQNENEVKMNKGEDGDSVNYYDKTSSFFDKISCEALERQTENQGPKTSSRPHWRRERELNTETFGQSAVRNYAFRRGIMHRGGFRGRGMRGQYGGYGGPRNGGGYYHQRY